MDNDPELDGGGHRPTKTPKNDLRDSSQRKEERKGLEIAEFTVLREIETFG